MDSVVPTFEQEVRQLVDRAAVLQVIYAYAEALDYGLSDQFVACFTDDALFEIRFPDPGQAASLSRGGRLMSQSVQYVGRQAIGEFFAQHTHAPEASHKHLVSNSIVDLAGDVAHARSYFERLDVSPDGLIFARAYGRYTDELRRVGLGWKIVRRIAEPDALDLREIRLRGSES